MAEIIGAKPSPDENQGPEMTREELVQLLEAECERELGISLEAFVRAWDAGELPDTPSVMHIALLVGPPASASKRGDSESNDCTPRVGATAMAEMIHREVEPADLEAGLFDLTREQVIEMLEERCQRHLGMSLDEFMVEWDAGRLPDTTPVMRIAMMIGESEQ